MKLLFPIFCFTCIRVGDADHQRKYIDLLPESDKQAFLDLVARRLHKEVPRKKSKHSISHEISDEQLDEHSDFVKRILVEEKDKLKQRADSGKIEEHSDEDLRVKDVNEQKSAETGYVDLTLRNNQRERRFSVNNDETLNKSNDIPVQMVYDDDSNIVFSKTTNFPYEGKRNTEDESTLKAVVSSNEEKDIQVRGVRRDDEKTESDTFTKIVDFEENENNDENDNKEESEDGDSTSVDDNTKKIIGSNNYSVTASIYESEGNEDSNNTNDESDDNNEDKENLSATEKTERRTNKLTITPTTLNTPTTTTMHKMLTSNTKNLTTTELVSEKTERRTRKITITATTLNTPTTTSKMFTNNTQNNTDVKQKRFIRNGLNEETPEEINKSEDSKESTPYLEEAKTDSTTTVNDINNETTEESTSIESSTITNTIYSETEKAYNIKTYTTENINASTSIIYNETAETTSDLQTHTLANIYLLTTASENESEVPKTTEIINVFTERINNLNNETSEESTSIESSTITNTIYSETETAYNTKTDAIENIDASPSNTYHETTETTSDLRKDTTTKIDFLTTDRENDSEVPKTTEIINEFTELTNNFNNESTEESMGIESASITNTINSETEKSRNVTTDVIESIDASMSTTYYETAESTSDREIDTTANIVIDLLTTATENVPKVNASEVTADDLVAAVTASSEPSKEDINTTIESGADNIATTTETVLPTITVHPFSEDAKKTIVNLFNEVLNSNKNTKINNSTPVVSVFNNLVKTLRQGLQFEFENNEEKGSVVSKKDHLAKQKTAVIKPKEYIVYEIPANKSVFVKQNKEVDKTILRTREEPYYVPVYNYSPEKAYFNAYNRLGPNYESSKEEMDKRKEFNEHDTELTRYKTEDDSEALRKFKFDRKILEKVKRIPKIMASNKNSNLKLPSVAKKKKELNLNDYLDMDYYFGRTGLSKDRQCKHDESDVLESSEEKVNPYKNMEFDTPKEYIREARQLLIRDQAFGFLDNPYRPQPTEESDVQSADDPRSKNSSNYVILYPDSDTHILLRNANPKSNDISIDYYFSINNNNEKETLRFTNNNNTNNPNLKSEKLNTLLKRKLIKRIENEENNKYQGKKSQKKTGTIREILAMSDPSEVFNNLEKLLQLKLPLGRRVEEEELKPYLNVIKDMIEYDNKALVQYDWLGTTVDILAAVKKMIYLIQISQYGRKLNPVDSELLKYIEYLHQASKADKEGRLHQDKEKTRANDENVVLKWKQKKKLLPRKKIKEGSNFPNAKGLIDRVWLYLRGRLVKNKQETQMRLGELQNFFEDLREALYDLHNTIQNIAVITKYKTQSWFKNIKELYLKDLKKKQCLEVLLHISTARFLGLVEESAGQDLEDSFLRYIEGHEKEVGRSKEELVFLIQVLGQLKNLEN